MSNWQLGVILKKLNKRNDGASDTLFKTSFHTNLLHPESWKFLSLSQTKWHINIYGPDEKIKRVYGV